MSECPICLRIIINNSFITECNHCFCIICINKWYTISDKCPICRCIASREQRSVTNILYKNSESLSYNPNIMEQIKMIQLCMN